MSRKVLRAFAKAEKVPEYQDFRIASEIKGEIVYGLVLVMYDHSRATSHACDKLTPNTKNVVTIVG